ncbi:MAG TPA: hypothetical protein VHH36_05845 [Candidatus Thermoplasmatota archaeon]|nr:hypothetical protein [Candidatus Thermoplasmatota archaeon]
MTRALPMPFWLVLLALGVLASLVALVAFGVPPFDNLATFLVTGSIAVLVYLIFGVIGGFFAGMVVAHRVLASREFTPFEREVLESLSELRERLDRMEAKR